VAAIALCPHSQPPTVARHASWQHPAIGLSVPSRLLLSGRKRPRRASAALLAEHEPQLLRWSQLRVVGTKRRARLRQLQRAQQVDAEIALITAHLRRTFGRAPTLSSLHQDYPRVASRVERNRGDQSTIGPAPQGVAPPHSANRRQIVFYPELACKQSRSCDNRGDLGAISEIPPPADSPASS
jgi:hypothetical protein